jgi:hypothetical protein
MGILIRKLLPHIIAIITFLLISVLYFYPVFEGKRLNASDITNWKGVSKEIADYRNTTGREALWTNSMFGGMPAYQVSIENKSNWLVYINTIFKFGMPTPINLVIFYFIGFYILLIVLRINPWLSIAGSLAFGFSSFFFIILVAGHDTQAFAIGYMAPVIAGTILCFRGKYLLGGLLTGFSLSLEIFGNHFQITYYLLIIVLLLAITELVHAINEKRILPFMKAAAVIFIAIIFSIATNLSSLWGTFEYSKYSTRGKSELTFFKDKQTSGLNKDYATSWSYGIAETMTLLIPNFQGGTSVGKLNEKSATYQSLTEKNIPNSREIVKQLPLYWGNQPFTAGPVYVGAIIVFLFIFGLFIVRGRLKWWLLALTLLSIMLAWGKNFMFLTNFFLDHFPAYNKFRAVSMTLVIAELTMPLLAIIALQKIFDTGYEKNKSLKALKISYYIAAGITLIFIILPGVLFNFTGSMDAQYGFPDWLMQALQADRLKMLRVDAFRSFLFISLTYALLWCFIKGKIKMSYTIILLIALFLIDMWPICKRYLNKDDFMRKALVDKPFVATKADNYILKDQSPHYRVFDLTADFDKSARTSYFHKNIGGYNGAKLLRFQELIDYHLSDEKEQFTTLLSNRPNNFALNVGVMNLKLINMLNARYIIFDLNSDPLKNNFAMGNAWYVPNYKIVENADQEITALNDFDPLKQAIIDKRYANNLANYRNGIDTTGYIKLTDYAPNHLTYHYQTSKDQLTLFSEIFYDKGWNASVDGIPQNHFRANYVLRACVLPKGEHTLEFTFRPMAYFIGEKIAIISSIIFFLTVILAFYLLYHKKKLITDKTRSQK